MKTVFATDQRFIIVSRIDFPEHLKCLKICFSFFSFLNSFSSRIEMNHLTDCVQTRVGGGGWWVGGRSPRRGPVVAARRSITVEKKRSRKNKSTAALSTSERIDTSVTIPSEWRRFFSPWNSTARNVFSIHPKEIPAAECRSYARESIHFNVWSLRPPPAHADLPANGFLSPENRMPSNCDGFWRRSIDVWTAIGNAFLRKRFFVY